MREMGLGDQRRYLGVKLYQLGLAVLGGEDTEHRRGHAQLAAEVIAAENPAKVAAALQSGKGRELVTKVLEACRPGAPEDGGPPVGSSWEPGFVRPKGAPRPAPPAEPARERRDTDGSEDDDEADWDGARPVAAGYRQYDLEQVSRRTMSVLRHRIREDDGKRFYRPDEERFIKVTALLLAFPRSNVDLAMIQRMADSSRGSRGPRFDLRLREGEWIIRSTFEQAGHTRLPHAEGPHNGSNLPREPPPPLPPPRSAQRAANREGRWAPPRDFRRDRDYVCPKCFAHCHGDAGFCNGCKLPHPWPDTLAKWMRRGDWHCPQCGALQFAWRKECFLCVLPPAPEGAELGKPDPDYPPTEGDMPTGDWETWRRRYETGWRPRQDHGTRYHAGGTAPPGSFRMGGGSKSLDDGGNGCWGAAGDGSESEEGGGPDSEATDPAVEVGVCDVVWECSRELLCTLEVDLGTTVGNVKAKVAEVMGQEDGRVKLRREGRELTNDTGKLHEMYSGSERLVLCLAATGGERVIESGERGDGRGPGRGARVLGWLAAMAGLVCGANGQNLEEGGKPSGSVGGSDTHSGWQWTEGGGGQQHEGMGLTLAAVLAAMLALGLALGACLAKGGWRTRDRAKREKAREMARLEEALAVCREYAAKGGGDGPEKGSVRRRAAGGAEDGSDLEQWAGIPVARRVAMHPCGVRERLVMRFTVEDIQDRLRRIGEPGTGVKAELIRRLLHAGRATEASTTSLNLVEMLANETGKEVKLGDVLEARGADLWLADAVKPR